MIGVEGKCSVVDRIRTFSPDPDETGSYMYDIIFS